MRALRRRQYYQTFDFYFVLQLAATEITTHHVLGMFLLWSTFDWRLEKDLIGGLKKMAVADLCLGSFLP